MGTWKDCDGQGISFYWTTCSNICCIATGAHPGYIDSWHCTSICYHLDCYEKQMFLNERCPLQPKHRLVLIDVELYRSSTFATLDNFNCFSNGSKCSSLCNVSIVRRWFSCQFWFKCRFNDSFCPNCRHDVSGWWQRCQTLVIRNFQW